MSRSIAARIAQGILVLGFGLALFAQIAEAKAPAVSVTTSSERGNFISVGAGTKWKSKSVVVEVGVKSKKTWKWSRVASGKTDKLGKTTFCSSKTLKAGSQLRLKSGAKVISTIKIARAIQLSGCGYVPPVPVVASVAPNTSIAATTIAPTSTVAPTTSTVAPTTTTAAPTTTTTVAPTTTTTTVPASTPAPTALALSAATDTGDSQSDGITKADTLVIVGNAQASSSVQMYVDGTSSGSACTANGSGAFSCQLGTVPAGTKAITAKATGTNGESIASQVLTIVVDRTAPTASVVPGTQWLNSNESTTVTITLSENSTTLTSSSIWLGCTMTNGCTTSNFSGSGRNYSVTFNMVGNSANGGSIGLRSGAYTDIAGNSHVTNTTVDIMYDSTGPQASLSRVGNTVTITFNEVPYGFSASSLEIRQYMNANWTTSWSIQSGSLVSVGNTGRVWSFTISDAERDNRDITNPGGISYSIGLYPVQDVDGNQSIYTEHLIP